MKKSACLLICFQRVDQVQTTLNELAANDYKKLYIHIDGPRNQIEEKINQELLQVISEFELHNRISVIKYLQPTNIGLQRSVITALDWFFLNEDQGIIIEDDLVFDNSFLDFMEYCLTRFKVNETVWLISGNQFFPKNENKTIELEWSTHPLIWGWGTWRQKWYEIREEMLSTKFKYLSIKNIKQDAFFELGRRRAFERKVDSWALLLAAAQWRKKKKSIMPPLNLVMNVGADNVAVHTKNKDSLAFKIQKENAILDLHSLGVLELSRTSQDRLIEQNIYEIRLKSVLSLILIKARGLSSVFFHKKQEHN